MRTRLLITSVLGLLPVTSAAVAAEARPTPEQVQTAVAKGLALLGKSANEYTKHRDCFSCHHQALPLVALTTAKARGFDVSDKTLEKQVAHTHKHLESNRERYQKGEGQGGQVDSAGYALLALEVGGAKPDATTAAVAEYLLLRDADHDFWRVSANRPPTEASRFTAAYVALRGLRTYGTPEQAERIEERAAKVRKWLLATPAKDTEDRVFRLGALKLAGADAKDIKAAADELRKAQRDDGGWSQTDALDSDAYATGTALWMLHEAGGLAVADGAYRRGAAFLTKSQREDGSWYVKTRSKPFQVYFESGFPYEKDQWISISATSWATAALALTVPQGTEKEGDDRQPDKSPDKQPAEPNKERVEIGTYQGAPLKGLPSVLVARQREKDTWSRVEPSKSVFSSDALVSLPGYASELRAASGVHLLLWGTLPEFNTGNTFMPFLYESAVTLHQARDFDLEFTLQRGRVYVSNHKDKPARVRVRFYKEVWDLTLQERDTEIVLELIQRYTPDINYKGGEEPRADVTLYVLKGKAGLKPDPFHELPNLEGPTGPALFAWDNKGKPPGEPLSVKEPIALLQKQAPPEKDPAKEMRAALDTVGGRLTGKQALDAALVEGARTAKRPQERALCTYCLGAVDAASNLLDLLAAEDAPDGRTREDAILALRRWTSRGPETGKTLYAPKKGDRPAGGLLIQKNYKAQDAEIIVQLLHDFSDVDRKRPETFDLLAGYLSHPKIAVRELAYFHLIRLAHGVKDVPAYDAAWAADRRDKAAKAWKELIAAGKLPPPSPAPPK